MGQILFFQSLFLRKRNLFFARKVVGLSMEVDRLLSSLCFFLRETCIVEEQIEEFIYVEM